MEELCNVYDLGEAVPAPKDLPSDATAAQKTKHTKQKKAYQAYQRKVKLLVWWWDSYLPMVVGVDCWGPNTRLYKLPIDTFDDENGKTKVFVTKAGEAFGLIQFENSRERWIKIFQWKDANPTLKNPPQYSSKKSETLPFKAKWSDHTHGQGTGWDPAAYEVYNERLRMVIAFREQEKADGNPKMKRGLELVKEAHNIPLTQTGPVSSRKRKAPEVEVVGGDEDDATQILIIVEDE